MKMLSGDFPKTKRSKEKDTNLFWTDAFSTGMDANAHVIARRQPPALPPLVRQI